MKTIINTLFLSIILALIDGKYGEKSIITSDSTKNRTLIESKASKVGNKSADLVTSGQHFSYSYNKDGDDSYDTNYGTNGKSYLKEYHYFHDKQTGYERKHDWSADNDQEIGSKKIKKDLYRKRNNGKNYDFKDMIEIKKWDDEEPPLRPHTYDNNYNLDNDHNYDNYDQNKSKIKFYSNISQNNNNNKQNYRRDDNKDNDNYSHLKYGTQHSVGERGRGFGAYDEDNQKWFTNMEDKDQSGSTDNEVKDQDNYNNFNSPKFIVNFHNFKPWNRIMRSRRHGDNTYDEPINDNEQDNYEIYSNGQSRAEDNPPDDRYNFEPKLLTNFNIGVKNEDKDKYNNNNNNNENYSKYKNDSNNRQKTYKTTEFKETVKKLKSRPKNRRYHYEKRVVPQIYANSRPRADSYRSGYESGSRDGQLERKFIEMPYDMFNTGWSSDQKPLRQRSDRKPVPVVKQYRYGF